MSDEAQAPRDRHRRHAARGDGLAVRLLRPTAGEVSPAGMLSPVSRTQEVALTADEIRAICEDRLARWTEKLVGEHATPVVLVGVGHDARKGMLVICAVDEPSVTN